MANASVPSETKPPLDKPVFKPDSLTKNLPLFSSSSLEEPESILVAQWDELDIQVVTFEPKVEIRIRLSWCDIVRLLIIGIRQRPAAAIPTLSKHC